MVDFGNLEMVGDLPRHHGGDYLSSHAALAGLAASGDELQELSDGSVQSILLNLAEPIQLPC